MLSNVQFVRGHGDDAKNSTLTAWAAIIAGAAASKRPGAHARHVSFAMWKSGDG
jgi:hypothetical protein